MGEGTLPGGGLVPSSFRYQTSAEVQSLAEGAPVTYTHCPICLTGDKVAVLGISPRARLLYHCLGCGVRFYRGGRK